MMSRYVQTRTPFVTQRDTPNSFIRGTWAQSSAGERVYVVYDDRVGKLAIYHPVADRWFYRPGVYQPPVGVLGQDPAAMSTTGLGAIWIRGLADTTLALMDPFHRGYMLAS